MTGPTLCHVLDIKVDFDLDLPYPSVSGERGFLRASGGTISGSGIDGTVEPQAGDWLIRRPDGILENDQRIFFTTAPGQHIYMRSLGITDSDGRFRCTSRFDTETGQYDWLTRSVVAGVGHLDSAGFEIRVYRLED